MKTLNLILTAALTAFVLWEIKRIIKLGNIINETNNNLQIADAFVMDLAAIKAQTKMELKAGMIYTFTPDYELDAFKMKNLEHLELAFKQTIGSDLFIDYGVQNG